MSGPPSVHCVPRGVACCNLQVVRKLYFPCLQFHHHILTYRQIQRSHVSMMALRRNPYRKCKTEEVLEVSTVTVQDKKRRRSCTIEIPAMHRPAKIQRTLQQ